LEPSEKATVHGGQLAVAAVLERFGLKKRVKAERALDPRTAKGKGYDPVVYVTGILFSLTRGGCSLKEVEGLNEDEVLKGFLGIERFPDESSVGEWLRTRCTTRWRCWRIMCCRRSSSSGCPLPSKADGFARRSIGCC
jgi:hypothetical protein